MSMLDRCSWCLISFILVSCHVNDLEFDKITPIEISPVVGVKLGSKSYTIKEILEDLEDQSLEIHEDGDLLITMVYREQSIFNKSSEIITINTISNSAVFSLPADVPALPVSQTIPFSTAFNFDYNAENGERVDSAFYGGGILEYQMYSTFPAGVDYRWTILDFKDLITNQDLTQDKLIPYSGSQIEDSFTAELRDYKSIIRREGDFNKFDVLLEGNLLLAADEGLTASQGIHFDLSFVDPQFSSLFGFFGDEIVEIDAIEFSLDALSGIDSKGLFFAEPRFILEIENSFGIEFSLDISNTKAILSDSSEIALQETTSTVQKLVAAPHVVGQVQKSIIELGAENSNLEDIFSELPSRILLPIRAQPNPSISSLTNNFLTDSSFVNVNAIIELPMVLKMDEFATDFDVDMEDGLDIDFADYIILIANVSNQMPFDGNILLELLNSQGEVISEIPGKFYFGSPELGDDGRTIGVENSESRLVLDSSVLKEMKSASKIRANTVFSTQGKETGRNVKLFSDYVLTIELSVIADITVEL